MEFENKKVGNTTTSSPFFKVFTDPKSALEVDNTKKNVIGGEGIRNNKKLPLVEIGGDDLSSANILRKYTGSDVLLCNNSFMPPPPPPPSSKNKNFRRKRTTTSEEEEDEDDSVADGLNLIHHNNMTSKTNPPLFPKPIDGNNNNHKLLHFSTTGGPTTKTKTKTKASSSLFHFESSRHIQVEGCDNNATATLETETEFSKDSRSMRERVLKQASEEAAALLMKKGPAAAKNKRANSGSAVDDEKPLYKGILGYTDYRAAFRRDQTFSADKASGAHGPHRTSSHIRVSAWFDYQPDVCKDYKETGYCGFGDSCNFLHDRGDYKSGWQMETEWEEAEKVRKRDFSLGVGHDDLDEAGPQEGALPFACSICRGPFVDPVVTTCKHYFCQQCALEHRAKNKKCFVCNKPTLGIFNAAQKIRKKMAAEGN